MPTITTQVAPQVRVPSNLGGAANRIPKLEVEVKLPPKVQDFAEKLNSTVANHPYFRKTWKESAKDTVRSFGSLARDAVIRRYGTTGDDGKAHFLGMTERGTEHGVLQILKRFAQRTPQVIVPETKDEKESKDTKAKVEAPKPKETAKPSAPKPEKVESRAAAEEVNRENMRLVQLQVDSLKSLDVNVRNILETVNELKKASDRKGLLNRAQNAGGSSLFSSFAELLGMGALGRGLARGGRGVLGKIANAGRALATRASTSFSPLAQKMSTVGNSVGKSAGQTIGKNASSMGSTLKNSLGKGLELGKNAITSAKNTAGLAQDSLRPAFGNLAEKAKTGSAQLLDVAKKGGSRGLDVAKSANQSILKMMPKNIVGKLGAVGAVAGGALAIADYNAQASEIDKQVDAGQLTQAEADAMKGNLIKKGAGSTVGAGVGTAIGSAIGSIIPGAGTIVGGMVGGWLGEKVGSWIGDALSEDPEVAKLQASVDQLDALAEQGNLHWTNVRAIRKRVEKANIDKDDKDDLLAQLDDLDKDAIKRGDSQTRAVLAQSATGQAMIAQAADTNRAMTPNGSETYANAFNANAPAPKVENSGNTTVTQVNNNNSTNNMIRSGGLESRNRDASLRDYRRGNYATVG